MHARHWLSATHMILFKTQNSPVKKGQSLPEVCRGGNREREIMNLTSHNCCLRDMGIMSKQFIKEMLSEEDCKRV